MVKEAKVISPPGIVAGEIGKRSDRTGRCGGFAGPVAANNQGLPPQLEENLRRAVRHLVGDDLGAKHLHVPVGRVVRVLADDVDVIEGECGIAHGDSAFSQQRGCQMQRVGAYNVTPLRVRCAALDTAQGIDTLCRERVRLPAPPAVLGPEHLPPTRRTVDARGRLRTGGDNHEGAVDADVVVKGHCTACQRRRPATAQ